MMASPCSEIFAVLATGHDMRASRADYADPWTPPSAAPIDPDATIPLLGTGLTMVDYVPFAAARLDTRGPDRRDVAARPR